MERKLTVYFFGPKYYTFIYSVNMYLRLCQMPGTQAKPRGKKAERVVGAPG